MPGKGWIVALCLFLLATHWVLRSEKKGRHHVR